ncbi:hypothetical protein M432DRAFT_546544 [Thermoascus aurantiacus ATCC 26904]
MSKPAKLPNVHTAGIYADMALDGPAIGTLVAVIDRAKNLPNRKTMGKQNPYCAARLGKEAKKTDTDMRGGQTPRWDQELRFTVHESPDYQQLKVSVFNDDKKTDLIGETWIDLKNVLTPGGGQSDQWHPLQYKGKYAGEVRIEMTFYDSRLEDEAVVEKRREAAEKSQAKNSGPGTAPASSSLSGPRQPKVLKRRPLPADPTGASPARNAAPEHVQPAPAQAHSSPVRPAMPDQNHSTPPRPVGPETARPTSRHAAAPDTVYSTTPHGSSPGSRPGRGYDAPEDFQREWAPPNPRHAVANTPPYPQDPRPSHREQSAEPYDPRYQQPRPQAEYDNTYQPEHHRQRQEVTSGRYEYPEEAYPRNPYETPPRQNNYQLVTPEQSRYSGDQASHGQRSRNSPYQPGPLGYAYDTALPESALPRSTPGSAEQYHRYNTTPVKGDVFRDSPRRNTVGREDYHPEYASMQPRVEDEEDEEPPPPPPVHRSGLVQTSQHGQPNQHTGASPTTYRAYSPEFAPSASQSTNLEPATSASSPSSQTSYSQPGKGRVQDLPSHNDVQEMPPSLVAGYDPTVADAESERVIRESRASRRHSSMHQPAPQPSEPQYHQSQASESQSTSPDIRGIPPRKSVSPRPPPTEERGLTGVPFSPDSYDALNPNAGRASATTAPAPRYETPEQAMEAARRTELEKERELQPIIGSDGRVIDPSDHLPTDTWAPEPERKSKKPEVVVRFKHPPQSSTMGPRPSPRDSAVRVESGGREYHSRGGYSHHRNYSTPNAYAPPPPPPPQTRRRSISPSPSSLYAPEESTPPIPSKVPVAPPMNQSHPMLGPTSSTTTTAPPSGSLDALAQEMKTIDIGSVGCRSGRNGKRYHYNPPPRAPPVGAGYAV